MPWSGMVAVLGAADTPTEELDLLGASGLIAIVFLSGKAVTEWKDLERMVWNLGRVGGCLTPAEGRGGTATCLAYWMR